jgi:hypothetical protein
MISGSFKQKDLKNAWPPDSFLRSLGKHTGHITVPLDGHHIKFQLDSGSSSDEKLDAA